MTEPGATRWPIVWLVVGAGMVAAFQIGKAPAAIPLLRAELGIDLVTAGWVISIFNALGVLTGIVMGSVSDTFGPRRVLLTGLGAIAAASFAGSLAESIGVLLVTRFVEGMGFITIVVAGPGLMIRAARQQDLRQAFGFWGSYMPAGVALIVVVSPPILDGYGWRGLWTVNAILALAYLVLTTAMTRDLAGSHSRRDGTMRSVGRDAWTTFKSPGPIALALCFATYTGNYMAVLGFLPTYLIERIGMATGTALVVSAGAVFVNVFGNWCAGWLLTRGARRWILIAIACVTMGLCGLGIYLGDLPSGMKIALCYVFSAVGGLLPASVLAATTDYAPRKDLVGTTNGLVMQGSNLGQIIGPPTVAALVAGFGGWHAAPIYIVTAAVFGMGLALAIRKLRERE